MALSVRDRCRWAPVAGVTLWVPPISSATESVSGLQGCTCCVRLGTVAAVQKEVAANSSLNADQAGEAGEMQVLLSGDLLSAHVMHYSRDVIIVTKKA